MTTFNGAVEMFKRWHMHKCLWLLSWWTICSDHSMNLIYVTGLKYHRTPETPWSQGFQVLAEFAQEQKMCESLWAPWLLQGRVGVLRNQLSPHNSHWQLNSSKKSLFKGHEEQELSHNQVMDFRGKYWTAESSIEHNYFPSDRFD